LVGKVPDLGSGGRGINPQVTLAQKTFLQLPGDQAARKFLLSLYTKTTLFSHENHRNLLDKHEFYYTKNSNRVHFFVFYISAAHPNKNIVFDIFLGKYFMEKFLFFRKFSKVVFNNFLNGFF
jgi:hypothetical protein